MSLYEHIFICRQDVSQQQVEALTEQLTTILDENGGKVAKSEYWGLRSLAYRVKKNRKGHYSLLNLDGPHAAIAEMERQMSLNDDILRYITIRVDEHDMEDSAPLQNKGRDRDDRRPPRSDNRSDSRSDNRSDSRDANKSEDAPATKEAKEVKTDTPNKEETTS